MTNKIKMFISLALAVLIFIGAVPAVAAEELIAEVKETVIESVQDFSEETIPEDSAVEETDPNQNPDPEPEPDPEPDPEPEPKPDPKPDDVMGEIWLCSINGSGLSVGHMWVYILNTSDEYLRIGLYDVPPGEGISVATFGVTRYDGIGVYYNLETRRNENYCGESYMRLKDTLTRREAEKVTSSILTANYWDPFFNCTTFACRIWNRGSNIPMIPMVLPVLTRLQMHMWGANDSDKMMYQPPENCYKQRGSGSLAYLEHCCKKTLDA